MTPDEADWLLARMSVAWPGKMLNVERFGFGLRSYNLTLSESVEACNRLEDTCKFWPSWAEFKTAIRAVRNSHAPTVGELQNQKRK